MVLPVNGSVNVSLAISAARNAALPLDTRILLLMLTLLNGEILSTRISSDYAKY